jgi:nicotinamide riboside kinase
MIRIAITGPESSGKTALTEALAKELLAPFFPEFALTHIDQLDRPYTQHDLDIMCDGHLAQFNESQSPLQIVDTDFIVLTVWSKVKFGSVSEKIQAAVAANYFDLHILCAPDIPWEFHPQREHPTMRDELFQLYIEELTATEKPFIIVSGSLDERIKKSIDAIAALQV